MRTPEAALAARGVPFVYCTGNSFHDGRDGFRDRPVLKKPFSQEELTMVLSSLLSHTCMLFLSTGRAGLVKNVWRLDPRTYDCAVGASGGHTSAPSLIRGVNYAYTTLVVFVRLKLANAIFEERI
jgi:hypothetical protein